MKNKYCPDDAHGVILDHSDPKAYRCYCCKALDRQREDMEKEFETRGLVKTVDLTKQFKRVMSKYLDIASKYYIKETFKEFARDYFLKRDSEVRFCTLIKDGKYIATIQIRRSLKREDTLSFNEGVTNKGEDIK